MASVGERGSVRGRGGTAAGRAAAECRPRLLVTRRRGRGGGSRMLQRLGEAKPQLRQQRFQAARGASSPTLPLPAVAGRRRRAARVSATGGWEDGGARGDEESISLSSSSSTTSSSFDWGGDDAAVAGGSGGGRKLLRVDSLCLGGTVASTCVVAAVGVSEAPLFLLAMPVVLPMVALLAYRDRVRRRHERELTLALAKGERRVSARMEELARASTSSAASTEVALRALVARLESLDGAVASAAKESAGDRAELRKSFKRLMGVSEASTNYVVKTLRADMAARLDGLESATSGQEFVESSLADLRRELGQLEAIQADVVRLVEASSDEQRELLVSLRDSALSEVASAAAAAASASLPPTAGSLALEDVREAVAGVVQEDWLRDELRVMRNNLAVDIEEVVARVAAAEAAPAESLEAQLEALLLEIREVGEGNRESMRDMQDALYSSAAGPSAPPAGAMAAGDAAEVFAEDLRGIAAAVDSLVEALAAEPQREAALPASVLDNLKSEIREAIRDSAAFAGGGSNGNTNNYTKQEVNISIEGLERKIDEILTTAKEIKSSEAGTTGIGTDTAAAAALPGAEAGSARAMALEADEKEEERTLIKDALVEDAGELELAVQQRPLGSAADPGTGAGAEMRQQAAAPGANGGGAAEEGEAEGASEGAESSSTGEASADPAARVREGVALMKRGRGEGDPQEALSCFKSALECFDDVLAADPESIAAYGNKGNTLLASARQMISMGSPGEAERLLRNSGRCYRQVLALNSRDSLALFNWGSALCLRAKLCEQEDAETAYKLYAAAIEKFEVALNLDPAMSEANRAISAAIADINALGRYNTNY